MLRRPPTGGISKSIAAISFKALFSPAATPCSPPAGSPLEPPLLRNRFQAPLRSLRSKARTF
jgi:hypothetical protein